VKAILLLTLAASGAAACANAGATGPASPASHASPGAAPTVSDPEEYADHGISPDMGAKYFGEIGGGDPYATGMAYPVWLALLASFPSELGGDVAGFAKRFGFLVDTTRGELPLGMHLTVDPNTRVPFVVANCQICHAERLRLPGGDLVVEGLGSVHVRVHAYDAALVHVTRDPAFDITALMQAATRLAREHDVAWPEAMRLPIVRATVGALHDRAYSRGADVDRYASGLPGRVATIESFAMAMNDHGAHVPLGPTPGWAKVPDVIGFPYRETLSWDGVGRGNPVALAAEADFAFGARPEWFETHRHIATSLYMFLAHFDRQLAFPDRIDATLAARGRSAFDAKCAKCHGVYADDGRPPRVRYREQVVPQEFVGTDPAREQAVTPEFARAANAIPIGKGETTTAPTGGYVPPVLLDVWARGTYGHAGQWPSLEVLARRPADRPTRFVVDVDGAYDLVHVGLSWHDAAPGEKPASGYLYDASQPGLGVGGHPFLADLPDDDRRAVLEYLKTL
jgi:mono/diheme cytochrome c family protein